MSLPRNPNETNRNFFQEVHEVVRLIPMGRVSTYGAIAHYLGARHGARMVGYALIAAAPARGLDDIPAQRVVNRNGLLTGRMHFATPTAMQEALEAEGVRVVDDQVVEFKKLFWDPSVELE
ncbi:MGMT family protein [Hymenobacter volaticus]|uniref:MGMT family protein n=1 Tax=Hymenobacter volaticus TaxID=2932254 RepID=A0ABY4G8V3_9BACT|nr:MGMT family protein [Hymenobacter volaticus]UOQ67332.1 MGMT family protein [Hymenobacter volaticus]